MTTSLRSWFYFFAISCFWGSTFFWQKLIFREIGPFSIVAIRFTIACLFLTSIMRSQKLSFPRDKKTWGNLAVLCLFYMSLPTFLNSWGVTRVDTNISSIINASSPLFVLASTSLIFRDEALTTQKVLGALLGFSGILLIMGSNMLDSSIKYDTWGMIALLASAMCYSLSPALARRMLNRQNAIVQAASLTGIAAVYGWVVVLLFSSFQLPTQPLSWLGIMWLGLLGSGMANLFYFDLLKSWGPGRTGMVAYVVTIVGLILGTFVLGERITWPLMIGSVLVMAGVLFANRRTRES